MFPLRSVINNRNTGNLRPRRSQEPKQWQSTTRHLVAISSTDVVIQQSSSVTSAPGDALVVVCLAVVTLPPRSTAPTVAGCCLVGCSVVRGPPLRRTSSTQSRIIILLYAVARWRGCLSTSASAWGAFWPPMPRPRLLLTRPPGGSGVGFP